MLPRKKRYNYKLKEQPDSFHIAQMRPESILCLRKDGDQRNISEGTLNLSGIMSTKPPGIAFALQ